MNAPEGPRWIRLAHELRAAGHEATFKVNSFPADTSYMGGARYSIEFPAGEVRVCIHDKRARDAWAGWQVHTEGIKDGLVKRNWPTTKKRDVVIAAVREAVSLAP